MSKFGNWLKGGFNKIGKAVAAPFNLVKKTVTTVVETPFKIFNKGADTVGGIFRAVLIWSGVSSKVKLY